MPSAEVGERSAAREKELKALRGELWIVLPFFVFSLYVALGAFRYKFVAATVPMIMGFATLALTGLRLFHILVPTSRIGQFKEAGLAGEFDHLKDEIKEGAFKDKPREQEGSRRVTPADERKAFAALFFSCLAFVLFGYVVGSLLCILGTAWFFYRYRKPLPVLGSMVALFVLLYVILHRLFGAEVSWGVLLGSILESLDL